MPSSSSVKRGTKTPKAGSKSKGKPATGLISKEKGARIFLHGYSYLMAAMAAFTAFVLVILFMRFPCLEPFHTGKEMHKSLSDAHQEAFADSNNLILFIVIAIVSAFSASLCKEALEDGLAQQVKKYFYVLASFVAMDVILQLKSIPYSTSPITFYFEVPRCIIAMIGIGITYSHIKEKAN